MSFKPPTQNLAYLGWWIATCSAIALALTSLLIGVLTRNPREFTGIPPAIALAATCCPIIQMSKQVRLISVFAMIGLNLYVWITMIWYSA